MLMNPKNEILSGFSVSTNANQTLCMALNNAMNIDKEFRIKGLLVIF